EAMDISEARRAATPVAPPFAVAPDDTRSSALPPTLSSTADIQASQSVAHAPPASTAIEDLSPGVPPRPAGFCTGGPERPVFAALTLAQEKLGEHHIACDIGCHLFSILPPFNLGATTMGYGLGASSAAAFNVPSSRRTISIMGDGGFWHNGLASGIGNAVFNKYD